MSFTLVPLTAAPQLAVLVAVLEAVAGDLEFPLGVWVACCRKRSSCVSRKGSW